MARLPRIIVPGQPQHVIIRGNNRSNIFGCEQDYLFYLDKLHQALQKHDCQLHAYVLMTNHIHFLITPFSDTGLSKVIQMMGRYYVQYYNYRYQRSGTLWEGRYKATLIDSEAYLLICMRYIELNPVRAGIVERPEDYPWSSHHYNALGKNDQCVTPFSEFYRLGFDELSRQQAYRDLFSHALSDAQLNEIRNATNKCWVLGDSGFKQRLQSQTSRRIAPTPRGGDRKSAQFHINRI